MKLALIGADAESLDFLSFEFCDEHESHELVAAFDASQSAAALRQIDSRVRLDDDWESLLEASRVDLVMVSRGQANLTDATGIPDAERRADQLRKLAQAAVPMLVFVPACEAIVGYEIEMIRKGSGGVIIPFFPDESDLERMRVLVAQGSAASIGEVEQIVVHRQSSARYRPNVLMHFARDVSLIRQLIGDVSHVTASGVPTAVGRDPMGPKGASLPPLTNLTVHLQGKRDCIARWSIGPLLTEAGALLTLVGERGQESVSIPQGLNREDDQPGRSLRGIRELITQRVDDGAWLSACRDQEVAEAVDRSLARGRTIELFNEEISEEQSFKSVMSMGGCLLLMMAMAVVGLAAIVEGLQLPLRDWPVWHWWPVALLVPVVVFLLLQLLQLAVKREPAM